MLDVLLHMESTIRPNQISDTTSDSRWHEVFGQDGRQPKKHFVKVLRDLSELTSADLRTLDERMEAVLREMGVTFDLIRNDPWGRQPWTCDLLPHVFTSADWDVLALGFRQRVRAFDAFLKDVYGNREILRADVVPHQVVLGSPHYQAAARGLQRPLDSFLHISGLCVCRNPRGAWEVKHHHFSHATGISYMMQNRRALARVLPELFQDTAVQSLAEMPLIIVERLRQTAARLGHEPTVVLLSPGAGNAVSSEQSFIARRMGIPVVAGGDLLVLGDCMYLKTVRGLERVDVVYNRVADVWLDPLVFRSNSMLGVPGLVHCLRKGTVTLINPVGAQLADDRSLLAFAPQIIRFYLGEAPILPTVPTLWLGDIDQREMVLEDLANYQIRPIFRDNSSGSWERALPVDEASLRAEIRKQASLFVAQPRHEGALTVCFEGGRQVEHPQDHILYAVRSGENIEVFPGALTRVFKRRESPEEFGFGWTSKDSWVLADDRTNELLPRFSPRRSESGLPARQVTSRVAEAFYWMGRYLERAHHQAYLISVIETLESEELNSAERKHYRPMWNRLLPPLETSTSTRRRSITTRLDRYRLIVAPEPGSVVTTFLSAVRNAESVQDSLSPEAWVTMSNLRSRFQRTRFREDPSEQEAARVTRRLSDFATQLIPQFFAVCANSMLADDAWRFCEIGQMLERAIITANSVSAVREAWQAGDDELNSHSTEIELSAFLRLLGCRDAYRRIFQMRAEPAATLELLWQHPEVPRSVAFCVRRCALLLSQSIGDQYQSGASVVLEELLRDIQRIDWRIFVRPALDEDRVGLRAAVASPHPPRDPSPVLRRLVDQTHAIHFHLSDCFLNHQAHIAQLNQPMLAL
jgi:uncharacterized circularly permuted ATP-grasp superfamily protein/uncharacterized alpha-E superfamily protein